MRIRRAVCRLIRGLLADESLRIYFKPLDMHTEDWSHVYLCKGIGGDELAQLMRRLKDFGVKYEVFREELKLWKWPRVHHHIYIYIYIRARGVSSRTPEPKQ